MKKLEKNIKGLVKDFTCGYCFAQSGYNTIFAQHPKLRRDGWGDLQSLGSRAFAILECRSCTMFNLLVFHVLEEDEEYHFTDEALKDELGRAIYLDENPHIISLNFSPEYEVFNPTWIELMGQYPYGHKLSNEVSRLIRQDLQEAANCLAIGAANAAAIMCRRVIERLAAHFGVKPDKKRMLGTTLKELEKRDLIHKDLLLAFDEVKEWGNIGTHPRENDEGVNLAEANKIVTFVYVIVEQVFPHKDITSITDELKQIRTRKKANS